MDDLDHHCRSIYIDSNYGVISLKAFKDKLDELTGSKSKNVEQKALPNLFEFIIQEVEEMAAHGMKYRSLLPYRRHGRYIKEFADYRGYFEFEDVDWNLRLELIDWLTERNVQLSYGNKTLSILRQFMERARRKDLHSNVKYQGNGWMVAKKKATGYKVILTPSELEKLYKLELYGMEAKARDLFLIGAGTGQRYSDYSRYTPDNFYHTLNGVPLLSIISQKTEIPTKVPLNIFHWLIPTLEKYEYHSPALSMQKLNVAIKDICKTAGIDDKILKVEQYMGRKARVEKSHVSKYTEIASHTCRRSFATNLYRMGYKLGQIMPMTGHATEIQLKSVLDVEVSCFKSYRSNEPKPVNLLTWLTSDKYADQIKALRSIADKGKRDKIKSSLPAITISGSFYPIRKEEHLVKHSGLLCIDIDPKGNEHIMNFPMLKEELFKIQNVAYAGLSASGKGFS
ncbi:MAG: tyrosine-type recombinase/integrase [Chitinophagales bacterium]|nr:tyrosine-type recombinase/integrase [Chitinophagales bacterium]